MNYTTQTFTIPEIQGISQKQIDIHLGLYGGYVKHVNLLMGELARLASDPQQNAYLIGEMRKRLGFEFSGMRLHELYFSAIEKGPMIINGDTALHRAIVGQFGSFDTWIKSFTAVNGRGPGWSLLEYDPATKQFHHVWVEDHQVGQLAGLPIVLALDHWEHAYMVDYAPAEKATYVDAYLAAVNWGVISDRFDAIASAKQ